GARASGVFSQRLRQHVFVEGEVGHQALQPRVLVLELAQAAQLAHAQVGVLLLPDIERGLADAELAADVWHRRAGFDLAERIRDLLLGELRALHRSPPGCGGPPKLRLYSRSDLPSFSGETSIQLKLLAVRRLLLRCTSLQDVDVSLPKQSIRVRNRANNRTVFTRR